MTQVAQNPVQALLRLTNGYQISQAIHAAATLQIADHLGDEPLAADAVAEAVGADPDAIYRLLRALGTVGVVAESEDHRFTSTAVLDLMRSDSPASMRGWAAMIGRPLHWESWGSFVDSVRTGKDSFRSRFDMGVWDYRASKPDETAVFSAAMAALSLPVAPAVIAAYDFGRFDTIVDVGGADGSLLAAILRANPDTRGVVFDLPHVVAGAEAVISAAELQDRLTTVAGSYFDTIPRGGDAYMMKSVLHDCGDEESARILRNVREAMDPAATLLVVEAVVSATNPSQRDAFSDLNMLVNTGGRERRLDEWESVFAAGGFALHSTTPTSSPFQVIEGRPAA